MLSGLACCNKVLCNGKHQIMVLLLPADFCDRHVAILGAMNHSVAALSPCTIAELPHAKILDVTERHPLITRALW